MSSTLLHDEFINGLADPATRVSGLTDAQLLAGLLCSGIKREKALRSASALLREYGGLLGVRRASNRQRSERPGLDDRDAMRIRIAHEMVRRQLKQTLERGTSLTSPSMTADYLQTSLRDRSREVFTCLFLDKIGRAHV